MDPPAEDSTDESSIKPVSSLRSHFENIAVSKPKPKPPPSFSSRSPQVGTLGKTDSFSAHSTGLDGRTSVGTSSPEPPLGSLSLSRSAGQGHIVEERRTSSPIQFDGPRDKPSLMGFSNYVRATPAVTIQSPFSPQRSTASNVSVGQSPPAPPGLISSSPPQHPPSSPQFRQSRGPSRAGTPTFESLQSTILHSPTSQTPTLDPRKPSFGTTDIPRPHVQSHAGQPPPVNRAGKPKNFNASSPIADKPSTQLAAPISKGGDRASPFSTPPSSDEGEASPPASSPPPGAIPIVSRPPTSKFGRDPFSNPSLNVQEDTRRRHQSQSQISEISIGSSVRSSRQHNALGIRSPSLPTDSLDVQERRPGLPPRRDAPVSYTGQTYKEPPRRSFDVSRSMTPDTALPDIAPKRAQIPATNKAARASEMSLPDALPDSGRRSMDTRRNDRSPPRAGRRGESEPNPSSADQSSPALTDFPDSSRSNRRAPYLKSSPQVIPTGYDTKLFAICGEYVCTSGYMTRVWSTVTGELIMNLSHGDTVKVTAMAFKPAGDGESEGHRLWVGTNAGELQEIDIPSQRSVEAKLNSHAKKPIVKIFRQASEMWTLDEDGKLNFWPPDETGVPFLHQTPGSINLPRGHTFSMVASSQLWYAAGKDIRVIRRNASQQTTTHVFAQSFSQAGVGEVTCGAVISSQQDFIYFGHGDGKVTVYSRVDYSCVQIVNVSLYKISSLCGVGDHLWAGYNTGMIYVYDTTTKPWTIKKDWHAHEKSISGVSVDLTSIWKLERLQVATLATDNMIRLWDGLLMEDWLDTEMHRRDTEYCSFRELSAMLMTWNAGASKPGSLKQDARDAAFFQELLRFKNPPEILVFGFQELVDLEDTKVTAKSLFRSSKKKDATQKEHISHQYRAWRDHLANVIADCFPGPTSYTLLHTANLIGLFTCIFVKADERSKIRDVQAGEVKLGMGGLHGNKGALVVRFMVDDSSICFTNCHLAAGQGNTAHRNNDIASIFEATVLPGQKDLTARSDVYVGGGDGSMILDHEICILNGDLNYRIDTIPRDKVIQAIDDNNLTKLLERDQLLLSRKRNPGFKLRAFQEGGITFAPTYKYDVGTDRYDTSEKKRSPAWCDRILYRGLRSVKQIDYRRHEVRVSDHRPVSGLFNLRVKTISPREKKLVLQQCEDSFEATKVLLAKHIKLDYLCNVLGLTTKEATRLLQK